MDLTVCLSNDYTVDWGDPFREMTTFIKTPIIETPILKEDFDASEKINKGYGPKLTLSEEFIKANTDVETSYSNTDLYDHVTASFKLSSTEPIFKVHGTVSTLCHNQQEYEDKLRVLKNKLTEVLVHKVKTYYEGKDIKERMENMPLTMCISDEICKYVMPTSKTAKSNPKWIEGLPAVDKVETYNNRGVKVTFIDGTFTKAVCSENDIFDLDVGITICAMKRLLGTNSDNATKEFNRFIKYVHSVMKKNALDEVAEEARKAKEKSKRRKMELKKAAKKLKAKEEQIDIQKQAIIRAHQEMEGMAQ